MIRILTLAIAFVFGSCASVSAQSIETRFFPVTPTIQAAAYASGNAIGALQTVNNACLTRTNKGEIRGVSVYDKAAQGVDLWLVVFSGNPTASTFADKTAVTVNDADLAKVSAVVPITDHRAFADNSVDAAKNIAYPFQCDSTGKVYLLLVSRGAPTYATTGDITYQLEFIND